VWAMVMLKVPNSRLVLAGIELQRQPSLSTQFAELGIDEARLTFHPRLATADYLALHHQVDLCLDTFPHGGGATTAHAAWMGVPTLCLAGATPASRFSASLMHQLELDAFVCDTIDTFVANGVRWSLHGSALADIRSGLRARFVASPLGQPRAFAHHLEQSLRAMWARWCAGLAPSSVLNLELPQVAPSLTIAAPALKPVPASQQKVRVISASQRSEADFWTHSALGQSLGAHMARDPRLALSVACSNRRGLSELFNQAIADFPDAVLVFVHDDVWIDEPYFVDAVLAGLHQFDVIGVAGNRRRLAGQPAWPFVDLQFTWDAREQLSGRVGHGHTAHGQITVYGPTPAPCALLDGVFLAAYCSTLRERGVGFDAQFDFHFYDLDFCRSATQAGLRLGTWPLALTHQSGGAFGSPAWQQKYALYAAKWKEEAPPISHGTTHTAQAAVSADPVAEALSAADEFEVSGQFNYALNVYQEVIKHYEGHGETHYRLGKLAQRLNAFAQASQHLQAAVQSDPTNERYWLGFIHHLILTQEAEVVSDAINLAKNNGLPPATALALQSTLDADRLIKAAKRAALQAEAGTVVTVTAAPAAASTSARQASAHFCPVCSRDVVAFVPLSTQYQQVYAQFNSAHPLQRYETLNLAHYACPHCAASDRDRLMASYFLLDGAQRRGSAYGRILEIAPSRPLSQLLRSHAVEYRSADLFDPSAMDRVDITDMRPYTEARFDWLVCSHVLEHVQDDGAALREIHRVLAPGGRALLLVPIPLDQQSTDELSGQEGAVSEAERIRRFGQNDHLRMYAKADFARRIEAAGLALTQVGQSHFPAGTFATMGLIESSCLYVATKPF
jgi:SAM-dependent methyltransferase